MSRSLPCRALALALLIAFSSTGCGLASQHRPATTAAGLVVTALGVGLIAAGSDPVDSDHNGVNDVSFNDNHAGPLIGALLVLVGLGTTITAVASSEPAPATAPSLITAAPPASAAVPAGPGAARADGELPPLPELPATATVLRLAKQVRSIAHRGECRAAQATLIELASYDADYARALAAGPVMAPCPPAG